MQNEERKMDKKLSAALAVAQLKPMLEPILYSPSLGVLSLDSSLDELLHYFDSTDTPLNT